MPVAETMLAGDPVAIGYLNEDLLSEKRLELARRGLYAWTDLLEIELRAVLIERDSSSRPTLRELHDELGAQGARYVVVPDLGHLSTHPLLQGERVDRIQEGGKFVVLPVAAFTTTARLLC